MKTIPLTRGKVALVDDLDFETLSKHKWQAHKTIRNTFYAVRGKYHKTLQMHREILGLRPGDGVKSDHWDGDGLNNQRHNLRVCTHQQNGWNQQTQSRKKTSIYKGVHLMTHENCRKPWRARININGRKKHIGCFKNEEAAALAYNLAAQRCFREFARLNVIL